MTPLANGCVAACPGCAHRRLTAEQSGAQKLQFVRHRLAPWSRHIEPLRATGESRRHGYRDRSVLSVAWDGARWHFGLTRRDEVIAIPECPVHTVGMRRALAALATALPAQEDFPLAYVVPNGRQLTLVVKAKAAARDWCTAGLIEEIAAAGYEGLWLHLYPSAGTHTFASNGWELLWGVPRSRAANGLWYGPNAFRQLLDDLHGDSIAEAESFLAPGPGDVVADLYCGLGATLQRWVGRGASAIGVEAAESIELARDNAPGARLLRGTCEQRLPQLRAWPAAGCRLIYLNPPRTGLEPAVAHWVAHESQARRVAYLSCSPGTLARDLALIEQGALRVQRVLPYDFFPQTHHVETLVLLRA